MRAIGAMIILSVGVIAYVLMAVVWTGYQAKRLTSKEGRKEVKAEVTEFSTFVAKDKDFHKAINKEFKGTYIVFGLVALALIATALGLG
jgi:hypothetical protein